MQCRTAFEGLPEKIGVLSCAKSFSDVIYTFSTVSFAIQGVCFANRAVAELGSLPLQFGDVAIGLRGSGVVELPALGL